MKLIFGDPKHPDFVDPGFSNISMNISSQMKTLSKEKFEHIKELKEMYNYARNLV